MESGAHLPRVKRHRPVEQRLHWLFRGLDLESQQDLLRPSLRRGPRQFLVTFLSLEKWPWVAQLLTQRVAAISD